MAAIRDEFVQNSLNKAYAATDYDVHHDVDAIYEFRKRMVINGTSLNEMEKAEDFSILTKDYDFDKVLFNSGTTRVCEDCYGQCLATFYCEHCVRNYLRANFSNWTSGNDDIDQLIQRCQMKSQRSDSIVEWIPFNHFKDVRYLTRGGCSEIYSASWIVGAYYEWDSKEKRLKRSGTKEVVLKRLANVESAERCWFEEVCNLKKI